MTYKFYTLPPLWGIPSRQTAHLAVSRLLCMTCACLRFIALQLLTLTCAAGPKHASTQSQHSMPSACSRRLPSRVRSSRGGARSRRSFPQLRLHSPGCSREPTSLQGGSQGLSLPLEQLVWGVLCRGESSAAHLRPATPPGLSCQRCTLCLGRGGPPLLGLCACRCCCEVAVWQCRMLGLSLMITRHSSQHATRTWQTLLLSRGRCMLATE